MLIDIYGTLINVFPTDINDWKNLYSYSDVPGKLKLVAGGYMLVFIANKAGMA